MVPLTIDWTAVASQGIFAVLFVSLFVWTLNRDAMREETLRTDGKDRESRLLGIIDCYNSALTKLADKLGIEVDHIPLVRK